MACSEPASFTLTTAAGAETRPLAAGGAPNRPELAPKSPAVLGAALES